MQRRTFLTLSAAAAASAALPFPARAAVPKPYSWDAGPPMEVVDQRLDGGPKCPRVYILNNTHNK